MTRDKADKLIDRGANNPQVARAAKDISELLLRMGLGQAKDFGEIVEKVFPDLTKEEASALSVFFTDVADYFGQRAAGERFIHMENRYNPVRNWNTNTEYYYQINKVFCVLACDLDYCAENWDCWETRQAFCKR